MPEPMLYGTPAEALAVYAVISRHQDRNREAWPAQATIAAQLGRGTNGTDPTRRIRDAVRRLEAAGWIVIPRRRYDGIGRPAQNVYRIKAARTFVQLPLDVLDRLAAEGEQRITPDELAHWLRWRHLAGNPGRTSYALAAFASRYRVSHTQAKDMRSRLYRAGLLALEQRPGRPAETVILTGDSSPVTQAEIVRSPRRKSSGHPGGNRPVTQAEIVRSPRRKSSGLEVDTQELDTQEPDSGCSPSSSSSLGLRPAGRRDDDEISNPNVTDVTREPADDWICSSDQDEAQTAPAAASSTSSTPSTWPSGRGFGPTGEGLPWSDPQPATSPAEDARKSSRGRGTARPADRARPVPLGNGFPDYGLRWAD